MNKTLREWSVPTMLGALGLVCAYLFTGSLTDLYLSSTITFSSILVGFSSALVATLHSARNRTIDRIKRSGIYSRIFELIRISIFSFLCLIIFALLGFSLKSMSFYHYAIFPLTSFSIGAFINVVIISINIGVEEGRCVYKEHRKKADYSKTLDSRSYNEEARRLSDPDSLNSDTYKQEAESLLK